MTIKLKFLTLATLALTLGLTSCSNDKENEAVLNGLNKNIYVKIEKPRGLTRAESNPEVGGVVDFNRGYLYFTASNGFIEKYVEIIASGTPTEDQILIDDLNTGKKFSNLPAATAKVFVVGNTELNVKSGLISQVRNTELIVNSQADFKNVNLYGTKGLEKVSGTESEYTANVLLAPTVSRLELGAIKSKGDAIKSFEIEGVFVDKYIIKSDVEGMIQEANIMTGGEDSDYFTNGSDIFSSEFINIVYDWYTTPLASITDGTYQVVKPADANHVWGYNVFAQAKSDIAPSIVIRLKNVKYADAKAVSGPLFLTAKLKGVTSLEPGKIYTIGAEGIIFDETNLTPEPNGKAVNAEVTVTLATWDKVIVDVEL